MGFSKALMAKFLPRPFPQGGAKGVHFGPFSVGWCNILRYLYAVCIGSVLLAQDAMYTLAPKQHRCILKGVRENLKFRILPNCEKELSARWRQIKYAYCRAETA